MARFSIFASYMLDNRSLIYMEWTLIEAALPRKGIHYAQYVVQKGDTLRRVVARYSLAYEQLITANPWAAQRPYLQQGQMLYLPASRRRYVIQEHDTFDSIANTFRFRKEALEELNRIIGSSSAAGENDRSAGHHA